MGLLKRVGQKKNNKQTRLDIDTNAARFNSDIAQGNQTDNIIAQLLGTAQGTGGAEALTRFREATGSQDNLQQSLRQVAAQGAASGTLGSSGTGRAFQDAAGSEAGGTFQAFLQQLLGQQEVGSNARRQKSALLATKPQTQGLILGGFGK